MHGVACFGRLVDVVAPDDHRGESAGELEDAQGVVCYEEGEAAGAVAAVESGFFDHGGG